MEAKHTRLHSHVCTSAQTTNLSSVRSDAQDADLSDVLFDRAVLNGANLKNANLSRTIFTRSQIALHSWCLSIHIAGCMKSVLQQHSLVCLCRTDFGGANITGADFTNALVDKSQQIVR